MHAEQVVPTINPWDCNKGSLVKALSVCGAVYITDGGQGRLPQQHFDRWRDLWSEARTQGHAFRQRSIVSSWKLRFSQGEDLLRTLKGSSKAHTPDVRYNFGVGSEVLRNGPAYWQDLSWIHSDFRRTFDALVELMRQEIAAVVEPEQEPVNSLGAMVVRGKESWAGTRLRHAIYPANGSCTEHTDYGAITLQQSTAPGLEAEVHGRWFALQPPEGCALVFAGDMLERLTNGTVRALKHRVLLSGDGDAPRSVAVRQAHIIFLQPDRNTVVQPLKAYLRGDGADLKPVRYGDWHKTKAGLAFARS